MRHIETWQLERLLASSHDGNLVTLHDYSPEEFIFRNGDRADYLAIVLSGSVELRRCGSKLSVASAGAIFGEMGLIDGMPRNADAVALSHCRIATIGESQFHALLGASPQFALSIMRTLTDKLRAPSVSP
jgi:CRP-like cAMP-binding protein